MKDVKNLSIKLLKSEKHKCSNFEIQGRARYVVKFRMHDGNGLHPLEYQMIQVTIDFRNFLFRLEILLKLPPTWCFSTSSK